MAAAEIAAMNDFRMIGASFSSRVRDATLGAAYRSPAFAGDHTTEIPTERNTP
jgi:hypothetical protein